jgi:hypothetical protein
MNIFLEIYMGEGIGIFRERCTYTCAQTEKFKVSMPNSNGVPHIAARGVCIMARDGPRI